MRDFCSREGASAAFRRQAACTRNFFSVCVSGVAGGGQVDTLKKISEGMLAMAEDLFMRQIFSCNAVSQHPSVGTRYSRSTGLSNHAPVLLVLCMLNSS